MGNKNSEKKYFKKDNEKYRFNAIIYSYDNKWINYAEGYGRVIDILESNIFDYRNDEDLDFLIYPYCFSIRHYIELKLKEIIVEGNKTKKVSNKINIKNTHSLLQLLKNSEKILSQIYGPRFTGVSNNIEDFIRELHDLDASSQSFRYPVNKEGLDTIREYIFSFQIISEGFQEVKDFLDRKAKHISAINDFQ